MRVNVNQSLKRLCIAMFVVAAILTTVGWSQTRPSTRRRGRRMSGGGLKVGQMAPDFELPVLKFKKNEKGEKVGIITDKKVKLSSFRGKKSVVLWFSSYT